MTIDYFRDALGGRLRQRLEERCIHAKLTGLPEWGIEDWVVEGQNILDDEIRAAKEKQLKKVSTGLLADYESAETAINRVSTEPPAGPWGVAAGHRYAYEPDDIHPVCRLGGLSLAEPQQPEVSESYPVQWLA